METTVRLAHASLIVAEWVASAAQYLRS